MAWFIFSEVMFFAAFFGALFYVRTFAVPWLAGEGAKGGAIEAETIDKYKKRFKERWKEELDKAVQRMKKEL